MLFLLRPPQTRLPIGLPRDPKGQAEWNQLAAQSYTATRRVSPTASDPALPKGLADSLRELASLHDRGVLTDEEFTTAKGRILGPEESPAS